MSEPCPKIVCQSQISSQYDIHKMPSTTGRGLFIRNGLSTLSLSSTVTTGLSPQASKMVVIISWRALLSSCLYLAPLAKAQDVIRDRAVKGSWSELVRFPVIPVAAYIVPAFPSPSRMLVFSSWGADAFGGASGYTQFADYNFDT